MVVMIKDKQVVCMRKDVEDRERWRRKIHCGGSQKKLGKAERGSMAL